MVCFINPSPLLFVTAVSPSTVQWSSILILVFGVFCVVIVVLIIFILFIKVILD